MIAWCSTVNRANTEFADSLHVPHDLIRDFAKSAAKPLSEFRAGQVAVGDCSPTAPTDPYVRTLAHTVPLMMDSPCSNAAYPERYPGPCR